MIILIHQLEKVRCKANDEKTATTTNKLIVPLLGLRSMFMADQHKKKTVQEKLLTGFFCCVSLRSISLPSWKHLVNIWAGTVRANELMWHVWWSTDQWICFCAYTPRSLSMNITPFRHNHNVYRKCTRIY